MATTRLAGSRKGPEVTRFHVFARLKKSIHIFRTHLEVKVHSGIPPALVLAVNDPDGCGDWVGDIIPEKVLRHAPIDRHADHNAGKAQQQNQGDHSQAIPPAESRRDHSQHDYSDQEETRRWTDEAWTFYE